MIKLSRFDLADFGAPETIVAEIIRQEPNLPIPVPIDDLALKLDIVGIEALETEGFEGGLLTNMEKSEGIILVNKASHPYRRRFTIGHELGHFLCPLHIPPSNGEFYCSSDDMRLAFTHETDRRVRMEVEANQFAALLLMPLPHFRKDLRLRKGAEIEQILALSNRYETSKEATARRFVEVQDEPCAIVVSRNGCIMRFYRGEDFPFLDVNNGDPVPSGSLTAQNSLLTRASGTKWEERDGIVWLSVQRGRRAPMLCEEVLVQSDGYRLTLLTLAEDVEELEEEEELEESWAVRFRR